VDDSVFVGFFEPFRDLLRDSERLVNGNGAALQPFGKVFAFNQLHGQEVRSRAVRKRRALEAVDVRDVGLVERSEQFRLAFESGQAFGVPSHFGGQHLDRHVAAELRVGGAVHLAHPARADGGGDLVGSEARSRRESHGRSCRRRSSSALRGFQYRASACRSAHSSAWRAAASAPS